MVGGGGLAPDTGDSDTCSTNSLSDASKLYSHLGNLHLSELAPHHPHHNYQLQPHPTERCCYQQAAYIYVVSVILCSD